MNSTIFTLGFFGFIFFWAFALHTGSHVSNRLYPTKMGFLPHVVSIGIIISGIIMLQDNPSPKTYMICYGLILLLLLFFFMRLNGTHKDFSIATAIGIFGVTCGLVALCPTYLVTSGIIHPNASNSNLILQLSGICLRWNEIILMASVAIICGTLYHSHKIIRTAGLLLVGAYTLSPIMLQGSMASASSSKVWMGIYYALWTLFLFAFELEYKEEK